MALFAYSGINNGGEEINGEITAADQESAIKKIQESGCMVTNIDEKKEKSKGKSLSKKKVKKADLAIFSRQLSSMLSAGISITQALSSLSKQTDNQSLKEALTNITADIEAGVNLTNAFSKYPKIFPPIYLSMLNAGEVGGVLEESLLRLSIQLQKEKQISDNIKSATSYPKMIGAFAVIMFLAMVLFMVPIFEGFIPSDADIPVITQFTFDLSHSMRDKWYIWFLVIGSIAFGIVYFLKSPLGKNTWENVKMKIPLFGPIIQKAVLARFARTLSTLLMGGIPVVQALESAGPTAGSEVLSDVVKNSIKKIEAGKSVSKSLDGNNAFPPMVVNMIAIGEEAGTMPELLDKVAEFYEEDVAVATKNLGSVIEPIMLILIGAIVGGMLLSLYLPIFTVVTTQ